MTDSELRQLADAVAQLLRPHLERSEALRRAAGLIGQWLCEQVQRIGTDASAKNESATPATDSMSDAAAGRVATELEPAAAVARAGQAAEPASAGRRPPRSWELVPLKLGDALIHLPLEGTIDELTSARNAAIESRRRAEAKTAGPADGFEVDLALIEQRCRLKAASCRLFIEKRAAEGDPEAEDAVLRRLSEMLAMAKSMPNCFLWVFWRERTPPDDAALSRIADCYDAQADAVALVRRIEECGEGSQSADEAAALQLLAEASSALRVALGCTWLTSDDRDQFEAHLWLKREAASRRMFIERHMTTDDPADPENVDDLRRRIREANDHLDSRARWARGVRNALGQIRYHAGLIIKNGPEDSSADWGKIEAAVARLEEMGVKPNDPRIAEAVGPAAAALWPGDAADGRSMAVVVGKARALAPKADSDPGSDSSSDDRAWSEAVNEVRGLLRGKRMVIVGGQPKAGAVERLVEAFELKDAEWVELTEHGSSAPMRAPIHRGDTAVVLVIIKLVGHLQAENARAFANAAGKPCVLLSGGYNPERVAMAILDQASDRLRQQNLADRRSAI